MSSITDLSDPGPTPAPSISTSPSASAIEATIGLLSIVTSASKISCADSDGRQPRSTIQHAPPKTPHAPQPEACALGPCPHRPNNRSTRTNLEQAKTRTPQPRLGQRGLNILENDALLPIGLSVRILPLRLLLLLFLLR